MPNQCPRWTQDNIERLKELHLEGISMAQIAARMNCGLTRGAVIGKIHRLGLSTRVKNKFGEKKTPNITVPKPRKKPPMPVPEFIPIDDAETISIMETDDSTCKWPIDQYPGTCYCGRPTNNSPPYCPEHTEDAYQHNSRTRVR